MNQENDQEKNQAELTVEGLSKSFGAQKVLQGFNLKVAHGETVAVLGRSGTGKSVLLRLLIGLQKPDSGCIRIQGQEITGLEAKPLNEIRKKIGFLFQEGALYDSLTVEQNVEFPLDRHTTLSPEERKNHAHELLESVGMEHDGDKMPSEISGGMQKRVGLARALALDPALLLLDEPTAGLDPITAAEIGALISQLQEKHKMTSVVVTHDLHGAKHFANRLVMLDQGKVLFEGSFEDLQKSSDPFVIQYLKDAA
jgi:phospholipid/cholesterol/gamma-HCH transport system ATP-binding protein